MKRVTFTIDTPAMIKEIASNFTTQGPSAVGVIMGLNMILSGLALIAKRAHEINDPEIIRLLNDMSITREYIKGI